jgi:hypothetical protein
MDRQGAARTAAKGGHPMQVSLFPEYPSAGEQAAGSALAWDSGSELIVSLIAIPSRRSGSEELGVGELGSCLLQHEM